MTAFTASGGKTRMCVYVITHTSSGKKYVGQTTGKAYVRWSSHCSRKCGCKSVIKSAILKHGRPAFTFAVVDIAESREQLDHKEKFWIKTLNTISPNGYNIELGGSSGSKCSDETRAKISASMKGKPSCNKGKVRSLEQRKRISDALKGRSAWNKGIPMDHSLKEAASLLRKGKPSTANTKSVIRSDGVIFNTIKEASEATGCARGSIRDVISGKRNSVFGYTFRYEGEEN